VHRNSQLGGPIGALQTLDSSLLVASREGDLGGHQTQSAGPQLQQKQAEHELWQARQRQSPEEQHFEELEGASQAAREAHLAPNPSQAGLSGRLRSLVGLVLARRKGKLVERRELRRRRSSCGRPLGCALCVCGAARRQA